MLYSELPSLNLIRREVNNAIVIYIQLIYSAQLLRLTLDLDVKY